MNNPEKRDLCIMRVFDSPVEQVWKAWTDSQQVMQWWGPNCFTSPSAEIDFREGGTSLVCMRAPKEFGGQDMYNIWTYTKIEPMQSIEFIQNMAHQNGETADPVKLGLPPDFPRDQRNLVTFTALGPNRTEMTVTQFDWTPGQMLILAETGLGQSLDKMAGCFRTALAV